MVVTSRTIRTDEQSLFFAWPKNSVSTRQNASFEKKPPPGALVRGNNDEYVPIQTCRHGVWFRPYVRSLDTRVSTFGVYYVLRVRRIVETKSNNNNGTSAEFTAIMRF